MADETVDTAPEVTTDEQPTATPPPARKALYNNMVKDKLYSKSYNEFNKQFSTPEKVVKLHDFLNSKGKYDKGIAKFEKDFFTDVPSSRPTGDEPSKKKVQEPSERDSNNGLPTSATPSDISQPPERVTDTQAVAIQQEKEHRADQAKQTGNSPIGTLINDYGHSANLHNTSRLGLSVPGSFQPQEKPVTTKEQVAEAKSHGLEMENIPDAGNILDTYAGSHPKDKNTLPTDQGTIKKGEESTTGDVVRRDVLSFDAGVIKGVGDLKKTAGDISKYTDELLVKTGLLDKGEAANRQQLRETSQADFEEQSNLGLDENYVNSNPVTGIGKMIPMLMGGESNGAKIASIQAWGSAADQVDKIEKSGIKFENGSDILYKGGSALINYFLMKDVFGTTLLNSAGQKTFNGIVGAAAADATKELADKGANVIATDYANAYYLKSLQLADKIKNFGIGAVTTYAKVGTDFAAANLAESGLKGAVNSMNKVSPLPHVTGEEIEKDVASPFYNSDTPANGNLKQFVKNLIASPAMAFSALHVASNAGMLFNNSPYLNPVIADLQKDGSPEGIKKIKDQLSAYGKENNWSDDDIFKTGAKVDELADISSKVPNDLHPAKFNQAVNLILDRRRMEGVLQATESRKTDLDPSLRDKASNFERLLTANIEQHNDRLNVLVTDKPFTYFEHQGEYFKVQQDEQPIQISKDRYDLENVDNHRDSVDRESKVYQPGEADAKGNEIPKEEENAKKPEKNSKPAAKVEQTEKKIPAGVQEDNTGTEAENKNSAVESVTGDASVTEDNAKPEGPEAVTTKEQSHGKEETETDQKGRKEDVLKPEEPAAAENEPPAVPKGDTTVYVPTKSVKSDPAQFQPRGTDYSEESTNKIVNNFDDNKLDPIVVYKQQNGTDVVLSGHSRLEAHKLLDAMSASDPAKEKAIKGGYKPGHIKARYFTGTLDQAKEFADRSNDLATKNKDYESAASIRRIRQSGATETEINELAREDFGKDANYIKELSHLNPKGEVISALKQLSDSGDKATRTALEKIASWIGAVRSRFGEDISNSHENEMYKFLNNPKNNTITTKADFVTRIGGLVNSLLFNPEHPLNLNRIKESNPGKEAYDHAYAELSQKVKDKQAEVDTLNDRLNNPKNPDYIKPTEPDYQGMVVYAAKVKLAKNTELEALRRQLLDLAQKKGQYYAEGVAQRGLFETARATPQEIKQADEELSADGINTKDIEDYEHTEGTAGEPPLGDDAENVQQPGDDAQADAGEDRGSEGPQAEKEPVDEKEAEKRQKAEDAKRRFDNFIKNSRKTAGTFANLGEFLVRASELMAAYAELGIYKFGQMIAKIRADFGDTFVDENIKDLKSAYVLTRTDAMDEGRADAFKYDDDITINDHVVELTKNKPELPKPERDEMADLKTAYNKRKAFTSELKSNPTADDLINEFVDMDPRYLTPDEMERYNNLTSGKTTKQLDKNAISKFIDDIHDRQDQDAEKREKEWYKQLDGDPDFEDTNVKKVLADVEKLGPEESELPDTKPNKTAKDALKKLLTYGRGELRKTPAPTGMDDAKQAALDLDENKLSSRDLRDLNRSIEGMVNDGNYAGSGKWIALHESVKRSADILAAKNKAGYEIGLTNRIPSQLRSLPLNTEIMVKDSKLASVVQERSGIFDISAGNARVNVVMNKVTKQFSDLIDKMPKDIQSVENRYKRGILATFTQKAENDSEKEHFDRYKEYVEKTARRLKRSTRASEKKEGELVQQLYDQYVKPATTSSEVVNSLVKDNPNNAKIVNFFVDKHKEVYPQLRQSALLYSGKELPLIENYTSTNMKMLRGTDEAPIAAESIIDPVSMESDDKPTNTDQSRTTISRKKSIGPKRVMNLNFDALQLNKLRESHYDVQTLPDRHLYNAVRSQPDFKESLGNSQTNVNVISDGVATMVQAQRGFNKTDPVARMVLNASDVITGAAVRIAIAGIDQFAKHYPARAINTMSNLNTDIDLYFKAASRININNPIYNESAIALRGLSKGGLDIESGIRQMHKYDFSTAGAAMNALNKFYGGIDKVVTASLTTADELVARQSWAAYYMQDLRRRGIDVEAIDWATEYTKMDKEAAAYAEQMVSRNEIPNDPTQRAIFDQRGSITNSKELVAEVVKKLAAPFTGYSRNIQARIENDVRKFYGGNKKEATVSLASTTAETAAFQSIKILLKIAFGAAAGYILTKFDYDKPVTNPHWEELPSQTFDDMLLAGTGSMADNVIKNGFNSAYQLASGKDKGYIFKEYDPGAYGQANFSAAGMYGILPEKIHSTFESFPYAEGEIHGMADGYVRGAGGFRQDYVTQLTDKQKDLAKAVFLLDLASTLGISESSTQRLNSTIFNAIKRQKAPVTTHLETHHNKKSGSVKTGDRIFDSDK